MAILIRGKSKCAICNKVIAEQDEAKLFTAAINNHLDPLFEISDSACHAVCARSDSNAVRLQEIQNSLLVHTLPNARNCEVCRTQVTDPDNHFFTGFLTSDDKDPLFTFNFLHLHKHHLNNWDNAQSFVLEARSAITKGNWVGNYLEELIIEVERACKDS